MGAGEREKGNLWGSKQILGRLSKPLREQIGDNERSVVMFVQRAFKPDAEFSLVWAQWLRALIH